MTEPSSAPGISAESRAAGGRAPPAPLRADERSTDVLRFDEAAARRVLLVQAFEAGTDPAGDPLWSADDRAWATRLTRETEPADTPAAAFLQARADHALQRLSPREPGIQRLLTRRRWRSAWLLLALGVGLAAGIAADAIGSTQEINLLAPPFWGVVTWNLVVYLLVIVTPLIGPGATLPGLKRWLGARLAPAARGSPALLRWRAAWLQQSAPLSSTRAALLLHLAAAALALGLVGGLYLRGLVLDYRAGWQSTFLDAAQVRAALALLLAPASAVTGIAVPDAAAVGALRVAPGGLSAVSAAPWIHLYAGTLLLGVVAPRLLLAAWAGWRASRLSRSLPLRLDAAYVQRLMRSRSRASTVVQVLPHAGSPSEAALRRLQADVEAAIGDNAVLQVAATTAYGDEDDAALKSLPPPGTALRLAWVELGATAEEEIHGVFLRELRQAAPGVPLLLVAEEAAFRERFAATPARVTERLASWRRFAQAHGTGFVGVDSRAVDPSVDRAVRSALLAAVVS